MEYRKKIKQDYKILYILMKAFIEWNISKLKH